MTEKSLQIQLGEAALSLSAVIEACSQAEETALQIFNKAKEASEHKYRRRKEELETVYEASIKDAIVLRDAEVKQIREKKDQLDKQKSTSEQERKQRWDELDAFISALKKLEASVSAAEKLGFSGDNLAKFKEELKAKRQETEAGIETMRTSWTATSAEFEQVAAAGKEELDKAEKAAWQKAGDAMAEPRKIWQEAVDAATVEHQDTVRAAQKEYQETMAGIDAKRKKALSVFACGETS